MIFFLKIHFIWNLNKKKIYIFLKNFIFYFFDLIKNFKFINFWINLNFLKKFLLLFYLKSKNYIFIFINYFSNYTFFSLFSLIFNFLNIHYNIFVFGNILFYQIINFFNFFFNLFILFNKNFNFKKKIKYI